MSGSDSANGTSRRGSGAAAVHVRVLGPLEVSLGGQAVDIGGIKARALVARLLIDRGLVVSVDRLVDSLWGEHDGQGAEIALRSTISRVRKRLRHAGALEDIIVTRVPGYVLEVPAEVTDAHRFEQLVAEGRQLLGRRRPSDAVAVLEEAAGLWRGSAYSEVRDEPFARAEARRLEELLLSAEETRIDAELTRGRHQALIGELESLTSANPMRERLWSQRMLALYRSGRQAEALRVFQELRSILVAELGIEPGHDATWLEHAILTQDPALDFPAPPEPAATAADGAPTPPPVAYRVRVPTAPNDGPLVGREREAALVCSWWASVGAGDRRLLLVDGDHGIGKTRLVAELARIAEADGTLVLWGRCDEDPVAPFQPFAEALGRYFQSVSADRISQMPEWQLTELSRLVLRLRDYAPSLDEGAADPERERYRFFEAVAATLHELSAAGPLLLVVDDLHQADQPTLLLLRHVLQTIDDARFGIVGMYTDTEVPSDHRLRPVLADFRALHRVEAVHLEGLSPAAVEELVSGWPGATPDLVGQLYQLTDGNPLFLDEMLRQLRYSESEARGEGDAPVPPNLNPPEAIRELVARRVSRLPEDAIYLLQAAAVAGAECEAAIVAEAAQLTPGQRLDALDRAEESRLLRRVGEEVLDRYCFSHALVREAIYGELLRGRRVRYHHKIAVATERAHANELDAYFNELAHHYYMGAPLADADKAIHYCTAAGERALRLLAFEEAVEHFTRSLEVAERFGPRDDLASRCDALVALAEAQNRAGDTAGGNVTLDRAATLARAMADPARVATVALCAGPSSYLGIVEANEDQVQLLEDAHAMLPEEDSHLRAMVTARLGLVIVYATGARARDALQRSLALNSEAVAMARRLGDRPALGYALNARMHDLWGIEPAPERLAAGIELGEIADDIGDEMLALHGHMWRIRELLAQGDVDAVNREIARFEARDTGPVHPLESSYAVNLAAMMALIAGDFESGASLGLRAMQVAEGSSELVYSFYGALMMWTWWQRDELTSLESTFRDVIAQAPARYQMVGAALALLHAEAGEIDEALVQLRALSDIGWQNVAQDQSEGVSLALAAAACGAIGTRSRHEAVRVYESLRPYAGSAIVIRAPAAACVGPADQYLGIVATAMGDLALAEVHFEAALRLAHRMHSWPFVVAAEVDLARTLRRRGRRGQEERTAVLLRSAEEAAVRMGLSRLARMAAEPG